MLSVKQADQAIGKITISIKTETILFREACGRVLAEDIRADRDLPPFNRSLMDGIAVNFKAYQKGCRAFIREGIQPAGYPARTLKSLSGCIEIMTGAVLPDGCDCVIPVERLKTDGKTVYVDGNAPGGKWQHVHMKGSDRKKGDVLIEKGSVIGAVETGLLAAVGKAKVKVRRKLQVAVISSGDELVDVEKPTKLFQIRKANSYFMEALLQGTGLCDTQVVHFMDNKQQIKRGLKIILASADVVVLTGGVSMGKYDFIPPVMAELCVRQIFHKVRQKPGKPFWFGVSPQGRPVFALPGNPVSTQAGLRRYVVPFVQKAATGRAPAVLRLKLGVSLVPPTAWTYFLPVKVRSDKDGTLWGDPCVYSGSGDFSSLAGSDGFVEIPEKTAKAAKGDVFNYFPWK